MASLVPHVGDLVAGRYRVRGIAREGPGYLTVAAFDREVEVEVSLLWFRPGLFADGRSRQAFVGDAVRARGLAHPHLLRLHDAHVDGESVFVAVQVGSDAGLVKRLNSSRPADELDVIRYASAIGQGLEVAHRVGAVHGYMVPSDIVDVASQIKVAAVGLFGAASPDVARDLFWTRRKYIAPEVLRGDVPTPASDVFSLAVLLTELASGVSSVELADSAEALATQHIRLADIFARASRADPADRTQTVSALLAEVRRNLIDDRVPTSERLAVRPPHGFDDADADPTRVDPPSGRADSEDEGLTITRARRSAPFDAHQESLVDASGDPLGDLAVSDDDLTSQYTPVAPDDFDDFDDFDDDDLEPELVIIDTPPPELDGGTVETNLPLKKKGIEIDESPKTILGVAPASRSGSMGQRAAPPERLERPERRDATEPPEGWASPPQPRFVSHKVESETPRTPHLPVLERPDGQVKVRPVSAVRPPPSAPPGSLGNYAPPRPSPPPPRRRGKSGLLVFLWSFAAILAVVFGGLIAVVVVRGATADDKPAPVDAPPPPDAAIVIIDAAPPQPCPEDMALVRSDDLLFCIDLYEAPGKRRMPATELGRPDAEARCASRGARLCKNAEWQAACSGPGGESFPYGERYEKGKCNGGPGVRAELAAAGSFPECKSGSGAFDMSGNVAEWSTEGFVQGGSFRDRTTGKCSRRYRGSRQNEGYPDVGYRCCGEPNPEALAPPDAGR